MDTAVHVTIRLNTVADDATAAVCARRGERLDGTFKTIECVRFASRRDLKGLIVLVAAGFAPRHSDLLPLMAETFDVLIACHPARPRRDTPGLPADIPRGNFRAKDPSFPEDLHGLLMLTADLSQGKRLRADGTLKMRGQGMHANDSFERPPRGRGFQPRDLLAGYCLSRRDR
jgi:hypothetical protein